MNKTYLFVLLAISHFTFSQTANWETTVGNNILDFVVFPKNIIVMYGEDSNVPYAANTTDVVALDKFTGKKKWELKNLLDLMPGDEYVSAEHIAKHNLIRFGHLLLVDEDSGTILFNPKEEGITGVLHSTTFPEGILATVGKNRKRYQIFIPFETHQIAWTRDSEMDAFTNKKDKMMFEMMKDDPNMSQALPQLPLSDSPYKGYYYKGDYIVQFFKEIICFDLSTGQEKWKYRPKKFFNGYAISENEQTGKAVVYASTQKGISAGKNILYALDISTGAVLWEKQIDHSIAKLIPIHESNSLLVEPKKAIGKRYFQIYGEDGSPQLAEKSLQSFGHGIYGVIKNQNRLVLIAESGESESPAEIHYGFIRLGISQRGWATKFKALINIIDLDTKQYVFEKRFKTGDLVNYLELLNDGMLIVENNQAYVVDYQTGDKKAPAIKSNHELLYRDYDDSNFYIIPERLSSLHKIDRNTGAIHPIADLSLTDVDLKYVTDLGHTQNGYTLFGYSASNEFAFVDLDASGKVVNASTALSENDIILSNIAHYIVIENKKRQNIGRYSVDYENNIIIHVPIARETSPLDKKAFNYNKLGVISAKTYK